MPAFLPPPVLAAPRATRPVRDPRAPPVMAQRTSRRPRAPPDPALVDRARPISGLAAARKALRRTARAEPCILDAIPLASGRVPRDTDWAAAFAARNELTVKWLWLVAAVARKAHRTYLAAFPEMAAALSLADIMQEGVCGLITSVEKWDPRRGYAFDAFAFYSIKHAILRAIENQSRPIRLPVHVLNKLSKIRKVREQLELADGDLSIDNVASVAGLSRKDAELYLNRSRTLWSIDAPLQKRGDPAGTAAASSTGTGSTLREFLVDTSVDVARHVERECTREAVAELVSGSNLGDLERSVLWLKYGLGDGVERVRAEVSRILDVRVEKVRRAELSALKKIRDFVGEDISTWTALIS